MDLTANNEEKTERLILAHKEYFAMGHILESLDLRPNGIQNNNQVHSKSVTHGS